MAIEWGDNVKAGHVTLNQISNLLQVNLCSNKHVDFKL